jgi:WD40 repeat protein
MPTYLYLRFLLVLSVLSLPLEAWSQRPTPITALAFSPNGRTLAVGALRSVLLLDAQTGKEQRRLTGSPSVVTALAFRADGKVLAGGGGVPGRSGEVRLWDTTTGKQTGLLEENTDMVYGVAFRRDGKRLVAGSYDHLVTLWNSERGGSPKRLKDHTDAVYGVAFSPDGTRLASVAGDRTLKIWDAVTGKRLFTLSESTAELYCVAFRPDGKQIAAGGADKTLRIWNLTPTGGVLAKAAFAHQGAVLQIAYAKDGQSLLSTGEDNAVKCWDATTLAERRVFAKQPEQPQSLALSPKGDIFAVGRHDGSLALYSFTTGQEVLQPLKAKRNLSLVSASRRYCQQQDSVLREKPTGGATLFPASVGAMSPTGIQRGKTVRFTFFGARIHDATGVYFDDPALTGKIVTPIDSNHGILRVDVTCGEKVGLGLHRLLVATPLGTAGSLTFAVESAAEVLQQEPNNTQSNAQKITLPATLVGAIDTPGDTDLYRFEAKAGEEVVFDVVAQAIRSRLQPVLTLLDSAGKVLVESRLQTRRQDTWLGYRFTESGSYTLRVSDFQNQSGGDVYYRVLAGHFPYISRLFPLAISKGRTSTVHLTGFNLGGKESVSVTAPSKDSPDTAMSLHSLGGTLAEARGETRLDLDEEESMVHKGGTAESLSSALPISFPSTLHGTLWDGKGGKPLSHYYRFKAQKGQKIVLEVMARRRGSPLDSTLEITDTQGNSIERAVLRAVGQTEMVLNDRDSFSSGLRLQSWDDFRMNDYLMVGREVIQIYTLPKGPDDDVQFRSYRGRRVTFFGTTPEFHSLGSIAYKVEVHPAGSRFSPNGYPLTRLTYRNDDGGVLYDRDSWMEFVAPKAGEYVVRLSDARGQQGSDFDYRLMVRSPKPSFRVNVSPLHVNIPANGATLVNVEVERFDGFMGAVDLAFENVPGKFVATAGTIEAGENSALLWAGLPNGIVDDLGRREPITLIAKALVEGKTLTHKVTADVRPPLWSVMARPDLSVSTRQREVTLAPGNETTVDVDAVRYGKYGKRIPIDVRNLPYGVRVENVGLNGVLITEDETQRRFVLYCEPWVKPQTRLIYVTGVVEGGVNSTAPPILLRITPSASVRTAATKGKK